MNGSRRRPAAAALAFFLTVGWSSLGAQAASGGAASTGAAPDASALSTCTNAEYRDLTIPFGRG